MDEDSERVRESEGEDKERRGKNKGEARERGETRMRVGQE